MTKSYTTSIKEGLYGLTGRKGSCHSDWFTGVTCGRDVLLSAASSLLALLIVHAMATDHKSSPAWTFVSVIHILHLQIIFGYEGVPAIGRSLLVFLTLAVGRAWGPNGTTLLVLCLRIVHVTSCVLGATQVDRSIGFVKSMLTRCACMKGDHLGIFMRAFHTILTLISLDPTLQQKDSDLLRLLAFVLTAEEFSSLLPSWVMSLPLGCIVILFNILQGYISNIMLFVIFMATIAGTKVYFTKVYRNLQPAFTTCMSIYKLYSRVNGGGSAKGVEREAGGGHVEGEVRGGVRKRPGKGIDADISKWSQLDGSSPNLAQLVAQTLPNLIRTPTANERSDVLGMQSSGKNNLSIPSMATLLKEFTANIGDTLTYGPQSSPDGVEPQWEAEGTHMPASRGEVDEVFYVPADSDE